MSTMRRVMLLAAIITTKLFNFQNFSSGIPFLIFAEGKSSSGEFVYSTNVKEEPFHYMMQFGCAIGTCSYTLQFRVKNLMSVLMRNAQWRDHAYQISSALQREVNKFTLQTRIFLDEEWEDTKYFGRMPLCEKAIHSRISDRVTMSADGTWSEQLKGTVSQVMRPHVWYFTFDLCEDTLLKTIASVVGLPTEEARALLPDKAITIEWDATATQVDGSHFSYEYLWTNIYHRVGLAAFVLLLGVLVVKERREVQRSGMGLHPMVQGLNVCIVCQIVAITLHLYYLYAYSLNGRGSFAATFFSDVFGLVSQSTTAFLLIFVGMGYALNTPKWTKEEIAFPVAVGVVCMQLLAIVVDKWTMDDRFQFHSLEGMTGWILCGIWFGLWWMFFFSIGITKRQPNCPLSVEHFLIRKFLPAGSMYLLAFPVIYAITCLLPAYVRHKFFFIGKLSTQLVSLFFLATMFLSSKSDFFRVSELSGSILPGSFFSAGVRQHKE